MSVYISIYPSPIPKIITYTCTHARGKKMSSMLYLVYGDIPSVVSPGGAREKLAIPLVSPIQ